MDDAKPVCNDCGTALPAKARFCPECGARVASAASAPAATAAGERRPVAILFADLAGFTKLTSEADAEVVHGLLGRFFELVDGAIARFGGSVDKHIGDATMGVFGAPVAHGNDVERAVGAACEIHEAIAALSAELGKPLATHIGIASGEVVAASTGSAVRADYTVIGDAVNLASRLEELAGAGETIVSDDVRAVLGPRLDAESRGSVAVRGFAGEIPVWRVRALRAPPAERHRIVGRAHELARFDAALDAAMRSRGSTLLVRGDPGVGKSRLAEAMLEHAASRGCARHAAGVLDFGALQRRDAPSLLARSLLDLLPTAQADACREALDQAVASGRVAATDEPFVADLLGIAQRAGGHYEAMDHAARARGRIEALVALAAAAARERPVALLVEDVHWATPAVLDSLAALRERARELPLVLLLTTRHEADPLAGPWRDAKVETVDLAPLSTDEALELAAAFLEARPDVARRCVERAQGNPLFLTQLLQSGADAGAMPGTIRNVVLARLDRLPAAERAALQAASIAGQRFDPALVAHLTGAPAPFVQARARDLVRDGGAGDELVFSHALIRDGAYASLLHSSRRELHARAAEWFASRDPVLRAEHLERAEDPLAQQAFLEAARAVAARLRPDDALALARRGVALAAAGPVAQALALLEGELARDLGDPVAAVDAYTRAAELAGDERERCQAWIGVASAHRLSSAVAEGFAALDAAQPIAERLGLAAERARIAYLRGSLHFARGDLEGCAAEHERALDAAREAADEACEAQALSGLADVLYASGRLPSAQAAFDRCVALCDRRGDTRFALMNRLMIGLLDFYLGDVDRSLATIGRVRVMAREIGHRVAEVMADECAGIVLVGAGRDAEAAVVLERSLALARAISSRRFVAFNLGFLGRVGRRHGDRSLARARLDEAWSVLQDVGPGLAGAVVLAARACVAESDDERRDCLARGEALLTPNALSHNHFWYRADAIDATLEAADLDETLRHAGELERYAAPEPTPWSEFVVARAHALVAAARGAPDRQALRALRDRGAALQLGAALAALDAALATAPRS